MQDAYCYATKDQMKVWKATTRPDKDYPERSTDRVTLEIRKDADAAGYIASLIATDGYQAIRRNLEYEAAAKELKTSVPREAIEKAEKVMKPGNRTYFYDNRLVVVEVLEDPDNTGIDTFRTIATLPYMEQLDMFIDLETALQKATKEELVVQTCIIDARILKKLTEQLKAGDETVYLTVSFRGTPEDLQPVIFKAFEGLDTMELTAAIMPIRG